MDSIKVRILAVPGERCPQCGKPLTAYITEIGKPTTYEPCGCVRDWALRGLPNQTW